MTLPKLVLQDKLEAMAEELRRRPSRAQGMRTAWDARLEALRHEVRQLVGVEPEPDELGSWFRCQEAQLEELRAQLSAHRPAAVTPAEATQEALASWEEATRALMRAAARLSDAAMKLEEEG